MLTAEKKRALLRSVAIVRDEQLDRNSQEFESARLAATRELMSEHPENEGSGVCAVRN